GASAVMVVVVLAGFTVWLTPTDVLPAKLPSVAYVAVTVRPPAAVNAMLQLPAATLALPLCVPSLIVPVPVGVPLPGALADTVKLKLTAWPTTEGSGVWAVIVVVVPAAFTV